MTNLVPRGLFQRLALIFAILAPSGNQGLAQSAKPDFVPGEVIIGFRSITDLERALTEFDQVQRAGGARVRGATSSSVKVDRLSSTSAKVTFDFRTRSNTKLTKNAELDALEEYARLLTQKPEVEYAHPNWILTLRRERIQTPIYFEDLQPDLRVQPTARVDGAPNDPTFRAGLHWHYQAAPKGMGAANAWQMAKGERNVVVAVVDTGILSDHPDIKGSGNVMPGYNFITSPTMNGSEKPGPFADAIDLGDACPSQGISEPSWHGTHVAGTVGAAQTDNGVGIAGVNWAVSVLPVRALGRCGGTIQDLAAAIRWSGGLPVPGVPPNNFKADIINLSLGIGLSCSAQNVGVLIQAIEAARKAGSTIVVAAGNESVDIKDVTPASCKGVISVAASDQRGHLAPYSNFGDVTVMAPGGDLKRDDDGDGRMDGVWSLVAPSAMRPSGVAAYEGTSMATPHVAAAIALLLSKRPDLRGKPDEIEALLIRSVVRIPEGGCVKKCGHGLLDANRMVSPEVNTSTK